MTGQSAADFTGRTVAHYAIVGKIGQGGMGVVYKARDTHLDRFVALKVLPAEAVGDPERKRRFVQEAKAASALNHPHIVTIHDIDTADGVTFIAMEFVAGRTLDRLIRGKGMPLKETLRHGVQIADALAVAHAGGIVHRDIKASFDPGRGDVLMNLGAFTLPQPGKLGTSAFVLPNARSFPILIENIGIMKRTYIREAVNVEFRFEMYNAFNRVVFGTPSTDLGNPALFGKVTSQFNNPRNAQFALKLNY